MRLTIKQRNDELNKTFIDGVSVDYLTADLNASRVMNKLGQIEDIEEELGIELITLFKAYHNGFHVKYGDGFRGIVHGGEYYLEVCFETKCFKAKAFNTRWYFQDYGKTWALTKEELE